MIVKTLSIQDKESVLKAAREKQQVTNKGKPIIIANDFSMEIQKARRSWNNAPQVLKNLS